MTFEQLVELGKKATPPEWKTTETSSGGVLLQRGKEYPLKDRHPQTHLQIVPAEDGIFMAELVNAWPEIVAERERLLARIKELESEVGHLEVQLETESM